MWWFSGSNVMIVELFLVSSEKQVFLQNMESDRLSIFWYLYQYWLLSTNQSLIRWTNAYYCIQKKSKILGLMLCIRACKCYCFYVPYLTVLMQWLCQQATKLLIAIVSPLFYRILNIRHNTVPGYSSEPQCMAPNQ